MMHLYNKSSNKHLINRDKVSSKHQSKHRYYECKKKVHVVQIACLIILSVFILLKEIPTKCKTKLWQENHKYNILITRSLAKCWKKFA